MPSLSQALTSRMNFLTTRQGVIAGNIANADTPGYLARDVAFKSYLSAASKGMAPVRTNPLHLSAGGASGVTAASTSAEYIQHNGNAVRLDQEMLKMQETQLNYRFMTELYNKNAQLQKIALGRQN